MADYYVDATGGDDDGDGTSTGDPWQTISKVNSTAFSPDDNIYFKRGETWSGEILTCDNNGTSGHQITYGAYGTGDAPKITDPPNTPGNRDAIKVTADYVTLRDLYVSGAYNWGIYVYSGADYCQGYDIEVGYCDYGAFKAEASQGYYENVYVHDSTYDELRDGGRGIQISGTYNHFYHCWIENCSTAGPGYVGCGFEVAGTVSGSHIDCCWVENCNDFMEVGSSNPASECYDFIVSYSVSVNNGKFCWLHLDGDWEIQIDNLRIENCTMIEDGSAYDVWVVFGFTATPTSSQVLVKNCLVHAGGDVRVGRYDGYTHDYNMYHLTESAYLNISLDTNESEDDPEWINESIKNFHLQTSSPAIDAGTNLGWSEDYSGRQLDASPDLGAYEYGPARIVISADLRVSGVIVFG